MKPRVFISSTFYDLRYIREDLSNFVKDHDFEPVLFEEGDIGYTPGKPLDESCYESMRRSDMVILIIGGSYGSPATGEKADEFKEYLSVTRKEFSTAVNEGIPLYSFVEATVLHEYKLYDKNLNRIEEEHIDFEFNAALNVFRFIKEIYSLGNITVTEFSKPAEIKDFLSKQWSDMFKNYLYILRENNKDDKLVDTVGELKTLVKQMNVMLDKVGSRVLQKDDSDEYKDVIQLQQVISTADKIAKSISIDGWQITDSRETRINNIDNLLNSFKEATKSNAWILLYGYDGLDVKLFFRFFRDKKLIIQAISEDFAVHADELDPVLNNANAMALLRDELINDENYRQLCAIVVSKEIDGGDES